MTEFGDLDFDPLTEEGRVDINEDEYEVLITRDYADDNDFRDTMHRRFGSKWRAGYNKLRNMWRTRNPNENIPEYMELRGIPEAPTQEWVDRVTSLMNEVDEEEEKSYLQKAKEVFPDLVSSKVRLIWAEDLYGQETLVVSLNRANSKPYGWRWSSSLRKAPTFAAEGIRKSYVVFRG
jgi:DUF438 domain-containing protein